MLAAFLFGLFSLLVLLALLGNLLVCAAIFYDRSLRRSPENLFLVSLAVSDLLVSILVMVFAAANDLLGYWPFGQAYCQFWICFDITCCTASILNLCAISLDRYCHISRPMLYVRYCSRRKIYVVIVIVWLLSALIGAAPLGFGFGSTVTNSSTSPVCEMRLPLSYAIGSSMLSFFVPAAVMVLLYTKLYLYARKHVRSIKTQLHQATSFLIMQLASEKIREMRISRWDKMTRHFPGANKMATTSLTVSEQTPVAPQAVAQRNTVNDQKARLTLGVIMGTFLFCWLPFFLVNIWRSWAHEIPPKAVIMAVTWLGYANSAANPVIYSIFNRDFRRAFKKIIVDLFVCCERDHLCHKKNKRPNVPGIEERRRSTRSSEAHENNNVPVATRLVMLNNNDSSCIVEEP